MLSAPFDHGEGASPFTGLAAVAWRGRLKQR
jgi:hypothetical protein